MAEVTVSQFARCSRSPWTGCSCSSTRPASRCRVPTTSSATRPRWSCSRTCAAAHGRVEDAAAPRKITLKRKAQEQIKVASVQGRARTVNVEVRAKKTYLNRTVLEEEQRQRQEEIDRVRQAEESQRLEAERRENEQRDAERRERERSRPRKRRRVDDEARSRAEAEEARQAEQRERERTERERATASAAWRSRPSRLRAGRGCVRPSLPRKVRVPPPSTVARNCTVTSDASARYKKKQLQSRSRRHVSVSSSRAARIRAADGPRQARRAARPRRSPVGELANRMAVQGNEVIKTMMKMGVMATINQPIDQDTRSWWSRNSATRPCASGRMRSRHQIKAQGGELEACRGQPVCDHHGPLSTTARLAARLHPSHQGRWRARREAITQHIGAYQVETPRA